MGLQKRRQLISSSFSYRSDSSKLTIAIAVGGLIVGGRGRELYVYITTTG